MPNSAIGVMPVYQLPDQIIFPPPENAEPDGLLAVGADLSVKRLLLAYSMGIFPWYSDGSPILWWSPDPRLVLEPQGLRVSKSLQRIIKKGAFRITMDTAFDRVIRCCAATERGNNEGTWIVNNMIEAYCRLHEEGFAHSIEVWLDDELVGGLYGISLGRAFFGESMFALQSNASKVALFFLVKALDLWGVEIIDCQVTTRHLKSLGAHEIPRSEFLLRLQKALLGPTLRGIWELPPDLNQVNSPATRGI